MPVIHFSAELGFWCEFPDQLGQKANGFDALFAVLSAFGVEAGHREEDRILGFLRLVC